VKLVALWLHVLGVVVWIGGLMYQAHVALPAARRGDVAGFADSARRARPLAWSAASLVVLTGFYNVTELGSMERAVESGAALVLAAKFLLVLVVVALAAQRDFAAVPRLADAAGPDGARAALGRIAWLDRAVLALAAVIAYLGLVVSRS
jgi:uncharacterized membrane protein